MPTFAYKARNHSGEQVLGTLVAESTLAAVRALDERALLPVHLEEVKAESSLFTGRAVRVSQAKTGIFYEQLADLLRAGVPILRAIAVLSKQSSGGAMARVLREVHESVSGGDTLADALEKHPQAFPNLHVAMIRAGETGGFLEDVLTRLSGFVARQDELRNKFVGSMIYPGVLLTAALVAVTLLMVLVVPQIKPLLESQSLPWASQVVFSVSDMLIGNVTGLLLTLFFAGLAIYAFFQSRMGKAVWAYLELHTPGLGRIYTMVALCRFCRIFGTLLANGIPILSALKVSRDAAGNPILSEAIDKAADNVRGGEPLAVPLAASKIFPPAMVDMIAVAEESNTLEKVLVQIADTQEARTGRQIDLFVRLLEPLMLLVMGVIVMFIAVALLLPILRIATSGFHG